jgi:hypothetical protein
MVILPPRQVSTDGIITSDGAIWACAEAFPRRKTARAREKRAGLKKNGPRPRKTARAQEKRPALKKNRPRPRKAALLQEKRLAHDKNGSRVRKMASA